MVRYLEDKIRVASVNNSNLNNPHNEGILSGGSDTFKISSQETFRSQNQNNQNHTTHTPVGGVQNILNTPDLRHLEDKLSKRMADSIESLAEIIKDQAKKFRR